MKKNGFGAADAECVGNGQNLVSIHDGFINTVLAQEGSKYFHQSTATDFWIGLTDLMQNKNWTWMDNSIFNFSNWAPNEPKNATGNNCAALNLSDGLWRAEDCFKSKPYICYVNESYYIPSTTPYPAYVNCPWPLIYFQPTHSCYGINSWDSNTTTTWNNAEKYCESIFKGGHLVSVHSSEELYFFDKIELAMHTHLWSGLYSDDNTLTWKWSDCSPFDFSPWATGNPKAGGGTCTIMGDRIWNDNCDLQRRALCKVKL
uniref:C-type lectin domain-containing protein n=1 Tax=Panagrolaimus davidi TaxID=227884 RepID=A0A914QI39_9BILA